jgi:plastocyanin
MTSRRSRRPLIALALAALLVAGAGACGREEVPPGGPPSTGATATTTGTGPGTTGRSGTTVAPGSTAPRGSAATAAPGTVVIEDYEFVPQELEVNVGDTVTWANRDAFNHYVVTTDRSIDSGLITPGSSWSKPFATPGTVEYYCDIHNYMRGTITVR